MGSKNDPEMTIKVIEGHQFVQGQKRLDWYISLPSIIELPVKCDKQEEYTFCVKRQAKTVQKHFIKGVSDPQYK